MENWQAAPVGRSGGNGSNAVSLNGANQYIALPSGVISDSNAITITTWVNLNAASNWMRIFDFGSGSNNYMYLSPQNGANGKFRFAMKVGGGEQVIDGTAALRTGGWHHVAVTLSGSTGTLTLMANRWAAVPQCSNHPISASPHRTGSAARNSPPPLISTGLVDDFSIYSGALTASQVTQVMNA